MPFEFALVGLAAGLVIPLFESRLAPPAGPLWRSSERVRELGLIGLLYAATVVGNGSGAVVLALAFLALVGARLTFRAARGDWAYALAAALLGPAVEATLVAVGVFDYTEPDVLGIPIWLPPLWANGGLVIRRLFAPLAVAQKH